MPYLGDKQRSRGFRRSPGGIRTSSRPIVNQARFCLRSRPSVNNRAVGTGLEQTWLRSCALKSLLNLMRVLHSEDAAFIKSTHSKIYLHVLLVNIGNGSLLSGEDATEIPQTFECAWAESGSVHAPFLQYWSGCVWLMGWVSVFGRGFFFLLAQRVLPVLVP